MKTTEQRGKLKRLAVITDPAHAAREAGLRYVTDGKPGITRKKWRNSFRYATANGAILRDNEALKRIKSLAIPPAWVDVWICPIANGHLQATGRDARGRKQSRYHPLWRAFRDETKYERMMIFGEVLPAIRRQVEHDLQLGGLPREKVLATIVRLLETTFIRVGNEEYARENHSYGLTTMRTKHVNVEGATVSFKFRGKSGVNHSIDLTDRRLARIVKRCLDLPGYELFQYLDDQGESHTVDSADVNDYLREITGQHFTAKDFRTWAGTVLACTLLRESQEFESDTQAKKNVVEAIKIVASRLGNTPSVCRKCYIHPAVVATYLGGEMVKAFEDRIEEEASKPTHTLRREEVDVLHLLQRRLEPVTSSSA